MERRAIFRCTAMPRAHSVRTRRKIMRTLVAIGFLTMLAALGGCNNAKSPEAVAHDVDAAQKNAATEVSNSEASAGKDLQKAADNVGDKVIAFNNTAARDAYNLAVARADGDRKVALAQCEAESGDAQKSCKDQADATYTAAKADAKASAEAIKQ
jgi:hypothetical protein